MRFSVLFQEIAQREQRRLILPDDIFEFGKLILPQGDYGFEELYCTEPGCDCRRVMLNAWSGHPPVHLATINHAFERPRRNTPVTLQTFLDPLNVQSKWSAAILDLVKKVLLADHEYRARLVRHYQLFKDAVSDPGHPCQRWLQESETAAPPAENSRLETSPRRSPVPPPPRRGKRKWR